MKRAGFSNIVLVLVVATVIIILSLGILLFATLSSKQAGQVVSTQEALFSAEGSMIETVDYLNEYVDEDWPPSLPFEDSYLIEGTTIIRRISQIDGDADINLKIEIIANSGGAVRQLEGIYNRYHSGGTTIIGGDDDQDLEVTIDDIEYKRYQWFTVQPGESWITKTSGPVREFITNFVPVTGDPVLVKDPGAKWHCRGKCPTDFNWENEESLSFEGEGEIYGPGTTMTFGTLAILDDNPSSGELYGQQPDNRFNGIYLNEFPFFQCTKTQMETNNCRSTKTMLDGEELEVEANLNSIKIYSNGSIKETVTYSPNMSIRTPDLGEHSLNNTQHQDTEVIVLESDNNNNLTVKIDHLKVYRCPDGYVAEPCEYTLQEGERGKIKLVAYDSVGVRGTKHVKVIPGEGRTEFVYYEVDPEPIP